MHQSLSATRSFIALTTSRLGVSGLYSHRYCFCLPNTVCARSVACFSRRRYGSICPPLPTVSCTFSPLRPDGNRRKPWRSCTFAPLAGFDGPSIASYHEVSCQDGVASYLSQLGSCTGRPSLSHGKHLHHQVVEDALELHPFIQNLLLHFYCRCGALEEAYLLFSLHRRRDSFSWCFLIRACVLHGSGEEALNVFERMHLEASLPDKVLYSTVISGCDTPSSSFNAGQRLHARLQGSPLLSDIVLRTALLRMYSACDAVDRAQCLFHESPLLDKISYNAMIEAYVEHGRGEEAIYLFEKMQWQGLIPGASTFVSLLSLCISWGELTVGKGIHVKIRESRVDSDIRVATALVSMYGRCGDLQMAKMLFYLSNNRDVVIWNALISAYAQSGHAIDALAVHEQMLQESFISNKVTFNSVLQACSTGPAISQGQRMHACIFCEGYDLDVTVGNSLVIMYGSSNQIGNAQIVFENLPEKNVVSWTAMITACAQHNHAEGACYFLYRMHQAGFTPNDVTLVSVISAHANTAESSQCQKLHTWLVMEGFMCVGNAGNALMSVYSKSGCLRDAQMLFDQLAEKDEVSWNALISGCSQTAHSDEALRIYEQMQLEGMLPNSASFACVLAACADKADLRKGKQIHVQTLNVEVSLDDAVCNSILNMYNKCGVVTKASRIFNAMIIRNVASWNSMITGYAQHGVGEHALDLVKKMIKDKVLPDSTTFSSVMTACIHSGSLDECLSMISTIEFLDKVITLDHVNCVIDAIGRLGRKGEAWHLLIEMPFSPNRSSYLGLLSACRHHIDVKMGQAATKHALELVPFDTAFPVLMSNLYAMANVEASYWDN